MLNIISRSIVSKRISGPAKVVQNLLRGLDLIGYPYVVNKAIDSCALLWIHDDPEALRLVRRLPIDIKVVAGPNLFIVPRHIPSGLDLSRIVYIHPSSWVRNFWLSLGFSSSPIEVWPSGVDIEAFHPGEDNIRRELVLVYYKLRPKNELALVENILSEKKIYYHALRYGFYKESEYRELLGKSRYVIWVGRQESQGMALLEALAMGSPILVWDVNNVGHVDPSSEDAFIYSEKEKNFPATTAPYFDHRCGVKIRPRLAEDIERAIVFMEKNFQKFNPREYITERLSLPHQARAFLNIYSKFHNVDPYVVHWENKLALKSHKNDTALFILYMRCREILANIKFMKKLWRILKTRKRQ